MMSVIACDCISLIVHFTYYFPSFPLPLMLFSTLRGCMLLIVPVFGVYFIVIIPKRSFNYILLAGLRACCYSSISRCCPSASFPS